MYQRVDVSLLLPRGEPRLVGSQLLEEIRGKYISMVRDRDLFEKYFSEFVRKKCQGIGPEDIPDNVDAYTLVKAYNELVKALYENYEIDRMRKVTVRVLLDDELAREIEEMIKDGLKSINGNGPQDYDNVITLFSRASELALTRHKVVWVIDLIDDFREELEARGISAEDLKNYYEKKRERTR